MRKKPTGKQKVMVNEICSFLKKNKKCRGTFVFSKRIQILDCLLSPTKLSCTSRSARTKRKCLKVHAVIKKENTREPKATVFFFFLENETREGESPVNRSWIEKKRENLSFKNWINFWKFILKGGTTLQNKRTVC